MRKFTKVDLIAVIREAFICRDVPELLYTSSQLSDEEITEILYFKGKKWSDITCDQLDDNYSAIFMLSPKAYCYYLPGFLVAGIKEARPELLVYDAIIEDLDRSPDPTLWDDYFLERWPFFSKMECKAIIEWVLWLTQFENLFSENSLSRAIDTLNFLSQGVTTFRR